MYADAGFDDILYGFPLIQAHMDRVSALTARLEMFHVMVTRYILISDWLTQFNTNRWLVVSVSCVTQWRSAGTVMPRPGCLPPAWLRDCSWWSRWWARTTAWSRWARSSSTTNSTFRTFRPPSRWGSYQSITEAASARTTKILLHLVETLFLNIWPRCWLHNTWRNHHRTFPVLYHPWYLKTVLISKSSFYSLHLYHYCNNTRFLVSILFDLWAGTNESNLCNLLLIE